MPGVLQVEALAQLAGIVCLQMEGAEPGTFGVGAAWTERGLSAYAYGTLDSSKRVFM